MTTRRVSKKPAKRKVAAETPPTANLPAVIPPPPEPRDRWGRPTKFRPWMVERVQELCIAGAVDREIAAHLGIDKTTLYDWRIAHPELGEAMKLGKSLADDRTERTAFEIANGYTVTVKKAIKLRDQYGNERVETVEEDLWVAPDASHNRWFLQNRRGKDWKDKSEKVVTGQVEHVHLTVDQMRERVAARLQQLSGPKEDE